MYNSLEDASMDAAVDPMASGYAAYPPPSGAAFGEYDDVE